MKIYSKILLLIILFLSFFNISNWWIFSDLLKDNWPEIHYCQDDDDCWIDRWIIEVWDNVDWIVTDQKASTYFQNVVKYLLTFLYLVSTILIIYSGYNLLTWIGDEDKAKKSKTMIIYVIIWILIIFLAWPIIDFVFNILTDAGDIT